MEGWHLVAFAIVIGALLLADWASDLVRAVRAGRLRQTVVKIGSVTMTMTGYTEAEEARMIEAVKKSQERNHQ